jgi:hypothetical protein
MRAVRLYAALMVIILAAVALAPAAVLMVLAYALYPDFDWDDDEPDTDNGPEGDEAEIEPLLHGDGAMWVERGDSRMH